MPSLTKTMQHLHLEPHSRPVYPSPAALVDIRGVIMFARDRVSDLDMEAILPAVWYVQRISADNCPTVLTCKPHAKGLAMAVLVDRDCGATSWWHYPAVASGDRRKAQADAAWSCCIGHAKSRWCVACVIDDVTSCAAVCKAKKEPKSKCHAAMSAQRLNAARLHACWSGTRRALPDVWTIYALPVDALLVTSDYSCYDGDDVHVPQAMHPISAMLWVQPWFLMMCC